MLSAAAAWSFLLVHAAPEHALALAAHWFRHGDYEAAASVYDALAERGSANGPFFINQGNAHLLAGNVGEAILAYRRAERYRPHDRMLKANLAEARAKVIAPPGRPATRPWWMGWLGRSLQVPVALAVFTFAWACLFAWLRRPRWWWPVCSGMGLVAAGMLMGAVWWEDRDAARRPLAVVRAETLLYKGNGYSYPPCLDRHLPRVLYPGVELRVRAARANGWVQIELSDGVVGWLPRDVVLLDREPPAFPAAPRRSP